MQRQVAVARQGTGLDRQAVAELLGVSGRTVRDWERCYEHPGTPYLVAWAYMFGLRLAVMEPNAPRRPVPVSLEPGELLVDHELRPIAVQLKQRREVREISQTDLAGMVGVSRSSLQRWEDDAQTPGALLLITWAGRLGCRVALMSEQA
ncbi:helix-turn-helix domain-containing protein [Catenulispora pinisilvae]|uniref:helix-turn-helix domain-containing protein n=1 Tax=Catenulispora pinisilvae TaxID=2705253 RepID=UPI003F6A066F